MKKKLIRDDLICFICLDLSKQAIETTCCYHLACKPCILQWSSTKTNCPLCRQQLNYRDAEDKRKLLNDLIEKEGEALLCKCGKIISKNNKDHDFECESIIRECYCGNFKGSYTMLFKHIIQKHNQMLINRFKFAPLKKNNIKNSLDLTKSLRNDCNELSYLKNKGKFYCDAYLIGEKQQYEFDIEVKYCDDGYGNNCIECMKLDIKLRSLPKGYLVNSEGHISKYNKDNNMFCCNIMKCSAYSSCEACKGLKFHEAEYNSLL